VAPYRALPGPEVFEAVTRVGKAKLGLEAAVTHLELPGQVRLSITESYVMIHAGRKPRRLPLSETRVLVARAFPAGDVALWCERAGVVQRLAGLEPPPLLDSQALDAARALDRLGERLETALAPLSGDARRVVEYGKGAHRALLVSRGERLLLFSRPIFREHPRLALEVHADGTVFAGAHKVMCTSRYSVLVRGDFLTFDATDGDGRVSVWLPWISPDDRLELATVFGEHVAPRQPE
jgi:hypothetical protein